MKNPPRVVVIGAGFGGLGVAIRLQARGFQVTLLEQRDQPGGRAYVYRDRGFSFDAGPTVVTAPFLLEELFALAGRTMRDHLTLLPVDPFYRIAFADGRVFNYTGDAEKMAEEVRQFNPGDVDGYARFVAEAEKIFAIGFEALADVPFSRVRDMLKIVPQMIRLGSHRSVYSLVSRYIKDDALRQVMSFHPLLVGGNPFTTTSIYSLIAFLERKWGVWFAKGGTGAIVQALVKLFESLGGELECNATVEEIVVERGCVRGVRLRGGRTLDAPIVVSNADAPFTYKHLLAKSARRKYTDQRIDAMKYSMGLVVAYFGTSRTYPALAHHTILLGPRYRGLLDDIFERKVLPADFSLYLHAPTRTDPDLAPPGCEAFYVLAPVPHLSDRNNDSDGNARLAEGQPSAATTMSARDWDSRIEAYRQALYAHLEATLIPDLRKHLVTERVITPKTFEQELSSLRGSAFSIQPLLRQSAYFRPHNRSEDVEGLFFVGAGTHPGAGMPGVLSSAKVVDRLIADREGTGNVRDPIAGSHARIA